jgi:hypothetical protein
MISNRGLLAMLSEPMSSGIKRGLVVNAVDPD